MTSIEEHLLQDIEAVSAGIVTTEQDLLEARADLEHRIDVRQHRDRRRTGFAVAAAAAVMVAAAAWQLLQADDKELSPVGPVDSDEAFLAGDPPTTDQVLGVWRAHNPDVSRFLWKFTADGVIVLDGFGNLTNTPVVHGTFDISGDAIEVRIDDDVSVCDDKTWTLRAVVNETGGLNLLPVGVDVSDVCGVPAPRRWVWDRVLPEAQGESLVEPSSGEGGDALPERAAVMGTWFDPAGGYLAELRNDGTYTMLSGPAEVTDRGTWTLGGSRTRLTLASGTDSATCDEGDQLVLSGLRQRQNRDVVLEGELERSDCGVPFDAGWIRLAP